MFGQELVHHGERSGRFATSWVSLGHLKAIGVLKSIRAGGESSVKERPSFAERIIWTGYRDDDLAEHYRAMDLLLYTRPGSEEGHRATVEALACGVPVISLPVRGLDAVLGDLAPDLASRDGTLTALADKAIEVLDGKPSDLADRCAGRTREFDYERTSSRLTALYASTHRPRS